MAQISRTDRQQMQAIAAEALVGGQPPAVAPEALDFDKVRDFFCEHWPMVKQVLQFLGDNIGGIVRWAIRAVIAAGDYLHGKICYG